MAWLKWEDLTQEEQKQAVNSYIYLRSQEEQTQESQITPDAVKSCKFERMEDGYIFVNL